MEIDNGTLIKINFNKLNKNLDFDIINNTIDITYRLK